MNPKRNRWQNSPGNTEPYGSGRAPRRGHELYEPGEDTAIVRDDASTQRADPRSGRGKPASSPREHKR